MSTTTISIIQAFASVAQAVMAIALFGVTVSYALLTKQSVELMRSTEEEAKRPRVAVYMTQREDWHNLIELVIGNYSNGIARDLTFVVDDELTLLQESEQLRDMDIIVNGIPTLAPQQVIKMPLLTLIGRLEELHKREIVIKITYKHYLLGNLYTDEFILSFKSFVKHKLGNPPLHEIANSMKEIKEVLQTISSTVERDSRNNR